MDETVQRVVDLLQAKGATLFALIDHSGEASRAGLHMRATKLVVFGSPRAGTPLMQAAPRAAIDLPLKILVWQDDDGATRTVPSGCESATAWTQLPWPSWRPRTPSPRRSQGRKQAARGAHPRNCVCHPYANR
ncbi:MAG TPA: DUF302 domain-containing protein [Acidothermaceae bacterium]